MQEMQERAPNKTLAPAFTYFTNIQSDVRYIQIGKTPRNN